MITEEELIWESYIINEALTTVSSEEYDDIVRAFFDDENLWQNAIQSRDMLAGEGNVETVKTVNDFYAQWIESDDMIYLIGIISNNPSRTITRADYADLLPLITKLKTKMIEGKNLLTSPNLVSGKMLDNIIRKIEKEGYTVDVTELGRMDVKDSPFFKFKTVMVAVEQ